MDERLSFGVLELILNDQHVDKPILQVLDWESRRSNLTNHYMLRLNDGLRCHDDAMLHIRLNPMITNEMIDRLALVQLDEYMCTLDSAKEKILIVLRLSVVAKGSAVGCRLGNPVLPNASGAASTAVPPPSDSSAHQPALSGGDIVRIEDLRPEQNRWTIRARVTNKSDIYQWQKPQTSGTRFSVHLLDSSGEIRALAFNEDCDRLYGVIEETKVYYLSNGNVKYDIYKKPEITFTRITTIRPCYDVTPNIPNMKFHFVPISKLQEEDKGRVIDVIGICISADDVQTGTRHDKDKEYKKRILTLLDWSGTKILLAIWNEQAEMFDGSDNPVVAVKDAEVSEYNGLCLSMTSSGYLKKNPDIPEARNLRDWYKLVAQDGTPKLSNDPPMGTKKRKLEPSPWQSNKYKYQKDHP